LTNKIQIDSASLYHGDCLEVMKSIPDGSIDAIITDPPYGTTACTWDNVLPFEPMWAELKRIIKPNGAIVLFGAEPFSSKLRISNFEMFKYNLIWKKNTVTGFMQAKTKPLKSYEDIIIFGNFKISAQYFKGTYNPQGIYSIGEINYSNKRKKDHITGNRNPNVSQSNKGYPKDIIEINSELKTIHPTQKPIALLEYLIKTYTNENETVLDFTMGSGTTGVACKNLNRSFIGIELDAKYFEIACKRIGEQLI
jgi:DNA modification methylase